MHCGQVLTITAWRSYYDADGVFEDGTKVEHFKMESFAHRSVTHPNILPASYRKPRAAEAAV